VWHKVPNLHGLNSHKRFQELALESARGNGVVNGVVTTVPHART
jgi:hypothetical protein